MSWRSESVEKPLDETDIQDALDHSDTEVLAFFPGVPEEEFDLLRKVVEFANHEGGTIFVGIDERGNYGGLSDAGKAKENVGMYLEERVEGDLSYYMFEHEIESSDIVEIRIKEFESLPCAVDGQFYKWKPVQTRPLSPREVKELMQD